MPSDKTRRVLKLFGMAATNLEEAWRRVLHGGTPNLDAELGQRAREVLALIDRLRTRSVP